MSASEAGGVNDLGSALLWRAHQASLYRLRGNLVDAALQGFTDFGSACLGLDLPILGPVSVPGMGSANGGRAAPGTGRKIGPRISPRG